MDVLAGHVHEFRLPDHSALHKNQILAKSINKDKDKLSVREKGQNLARGGRR
jgi:hypothetical protein